MTDRTYPALPEGLAIVRGLAVAKGAAHQQDAAGTAQAFQQSLSTVLLSILTFSLSLLGTFLVRSGVLQSIHAFGNSTVGPYFLALIGVVNPLVAAIQARGGMGVSEDTPIAYFFTLNRYVRLTDGPEEVHMSQLGKQKIAEYVAANRR